MLGKKGTSIKTPWKLTPWLSTWGDTWAMQKWHQVKFPLGTLLHKPFAKYCFYHSNLARVSSSLPLCVDVSSLPSDGGCQEPLASTRMHFISRNRKYLPANQKLAPALQDEEVKPRGNRAIKEMEAVTSLVFHVSLGWDKNRTVPPPLQPPPHRPHSAFMLHDENIATKPITLNANWGKKKKKNH